MKTNIKGFFKEIISVVIGILIALFINNWNDSRKLNNEKDIATKNIKSELEYNNQSIKDIVKQHRKLYETFLFMEDNYSKQKGLISTPKLISKYIQKYPDVFMIQDSTDQNNGKFKYFGEINFNFSLPQMNLKTMAWKTLKNSRAVSIYNFECMMELELIYNLTDDIIDRNSELLEIMMSMNEDSDEKKFIKKLKYVIDMESSFIEISKPSQKLTKCN